jgi:hypothetical protein
MEACAKTISKEESLKSVFVNSIILTEIFLLPERRNRDLRSESLSLTIIITLLALFSMKISAISSELDPIISISFASTGVSSRNFLIWKSEPGRNINLFFINLLTFFDLKRSNVAKAGLNKKELNSLCG